MKNLIKTSMLFVMLIITLLSCEKAENLTSNASFDAIITLDEEADTKATSSELSQALFQYQPKRLQLHCTSVKTKYNYKKKTWVPEIEFDCYAGEKTSLRSGKFNVTGEHIPTTAKCLYKENFTSAINVADEPFLKVDTTITFSDYKTNYNIKVKYNCVAIATNRNTTITNGAGDKYQTSDYGNVKVLFLNMRYNTIKLFFHTGDKTEEVQLTSTSDDNGIYIREGRYYTYDLDNNGKFSTNTTYNMRSWYYGSKLNK